MKTDLREHITWGIILLPMTYLYFGFNCLTINGLVFYTSFLVGSIYPDLDLCLSPFLYPRVKVAVILIKSFTLFCCYLVHGIQHITPVEAALFLCWTQFYLILSFLQSSGLFLLLGIRPDGHHRESIFHSIFFWSLLFYLGYKINFASLVTRFIPGHNGLFRVIECVSYFGLRGLAYGAAAHIFLDYFGSMLQYQFSFACVLRFVTACLTIASFESRITPLPMNTVITVQEYVTNFCAPILYKLPHINKLKELCQILINNFTMLWDDMWVRLEKFFDSLE